MWQSTIIYLNSETREQFIKETNAQGVMRKPVWKLMHSLAMFKNAHCDELTVSERAESGLTNIPDSPAGF